MYEPSFLLLTMIPVALYACPPIWIKTASQENDWQCQRGCDPGKFCHEGNCVNCAPCPDPYRLAELGKTEMLVRAACFDHGHCPDSCSPYDQNFPEKANVSLCDSDCIDVTPPPPEPTPVMCKDGCAHGYCDLPGECTCESGWDGELCDQLQCSPSCMNGNCNTSSGQCICSSGWGGAICDQDVRYCSSNEPCENGGTCLDNEEGTYTCVCAQNFTGKNCETAMELLVCKESCFNNGTCLENGERYRCKCAAGFTGTNCQDEETGIQGWMIAVPCAALIMVVAVGLIIFCCRRKLHIWQRIKRCLPSKNDSDVQLISKALAYHLAGTTVTLKDLHKWPLCVIHTCSCQPNFPKQITPDMTEWSITGLRLGFTYRFEVCRQTCDAEENGCCVTNCEVTVPGFADENEVCTGTMKLIYDGIHLRRSLKGVLERNEDLRQCISSFFQFTTRHSEAFLKPGDEDCAEMLRDILSALNRLDHPVDSVLRDLATRKPAGAEEFAQELYKAHPSCMVCPHVCHHMHGTTEWAKQHYNQVTSDLVSNNTSMNHVVPV